MIGHVLVEVRKCVVQYAVLNHQVLQLAAALVRMDARHDFTEAVQINGVVIGVILVVPEGKTVSHEATP